jgi:hypothetical protein
MAAKKKSAPAQAPAPLPRVERASVPMLDVPGGVMVMGTTVDDVLAMRRLVDADDLAEFEDGAFAESRPPRLVAVAPFLFGEARLAGVPEGEDRLAWLGARGLRLPSEAEWEWVASEGGRSRFVAVKVPAAPFTKLRELERSIDFQANGWGARDLLNDGEALADGWHPSYEGAPATGAAWDPERGPGVWRSGHTSFQSSFEVRALHVADRAENRVLDPRTLSLRAAADVAGVAPPSLAGHALAATVAATAAALGSGVKKERALGLDTLRILGPGGLLEEEAAPLVTPLLALAAAQAKGERAAALRAIADAVSGGRRRWSEARLAGRPHALRTALLAGREAEVRAYLDDEDAAVRAAAGAVVAALEGGAAALRARLDAEKKPEVTASLLLALAHAGDADACARSLAARAPLVCAAAAIGLALAGAWPAEPTPELVAALAQAIALEAPGEARLPWLDGAMFDAALGLVERGGERLREAAVAAIVVAARRAENGWTAAGILRPAIALAFPPRDAPPDAATLTPTQRALGLALCERPLSAVHVEHARLARHGIPADVGERRVWMGLEPPGAVDREIETPWPGGARRWTVVAWARAMAARRKEEGRTRDHERADVEAVMAGWEPLFTLEVALDFGRLPNFDPFDDDGFAEGVLARALAADPARSREAVARAIDRAERTAAGERLPSGLVRLALLAHEGGEVDARLVAAIGAMFYGVYGDFMLWAVGRLPAAQREDFLVDRIERCPSVARGELASTTTESFLERMALPQVVASPSERAARAMVRLAARVSARQRCWALIEEKGAAVPEIRAAVEALGAARGMGPDASKAEVEALLRAYPL